MDWHQRTGRVARQLSAPFSDGRRRAENTGADRFFNYPIPENRENLIHGSFYARDMWRMAGRLTLNLDLRLDQFATSIPAQNRPADQFGPPWVLGTTVRKRQDRHQRKLRQIQLDAGDDVGSPFNPNTTGVSTYNWTSATKDS